tara:strand:+ start:148 stop:672 length:525 start_codon:yes stop_codon:yes gene_type:complete
MPLNDSVDVPISQAISLLYTAIRNKEWGPAEKMCDYIEKKCKVEGLLITPREQRLLDCVNDGSLDALHHEGEVDYGSGISLFFRVDLEESKVRFWLFERSRQPNDFKTIGDWHVNLKGIHQRFVLGATRFKSNPATFSEAFPDLDPVYEQHVLQGWELYQQTRKELRSNDNFSF